MRWTADLLTKKEFEVPFHQSNRNQIEPSAHPPGQEGGWSSGLAAYCTQVSCLSTHTIFATALP